MWAILAPSLTGSICSWWGGGGGEGLGYPCSFLHCTSISPGLCNDAQNVLHGVTTTILPDEAPASRQLQ